MEEETYAAYGRPICRGNVHSRHSPPQPARALAQSGGLQVPSSNLGATINGKPRSGGVFLSKWAHPSPSLVAR